MSIPNVQKYWLSGLSEQKDVANVVYSAVKITVILSGLILNVTADLRFVTHQIVWEILSYTRVGSIPRF